MNDQYVKARICSALYQCRKKPHLVVMCWFYPHMRQQAISMIAKMMLQGYIVNTVDQNGCDWICLSSHRHKSTLLDQSTTEDYLQQRVQAYANSYE